MRLISSTPDWEIYADPAGLCYSVIPAPSRGSDVYAVIVEADSSITIGYVHRTPYGWYANGPTDSARQWQIANVAAESKLQAVAEVARITLHRDVYA